MVNKADLLTASAGSEASAELEHGGASSAHTLLIDGSLAGEGPAKVQETCDEAHRISDSMHDKEHMPSRGLSEKDDSADEGFPDLNTEEGTWGFEQTYDVEPRDINANLEWLRQHRTRRGASAVLLTSAVTGQGLHELMLEINAMLKRRQGSVDTEYRTVADDDTSGKEGLQHISHRDHQERGSMAFKAASSVAHELPHHMNDSL